MAASRMTGVRSVKDRIIDFFIAKPGITFIFTNEQAQEYSYFHKLFPTEHLHKEVSFRVPSQEILEALKGCRDSLINVSIYQDDEKYFLETNDMRININFLRKRNFEPIKRDFMEMPEVDRFIHSIKTVGNFVSADTHSVEMGGGFLRLKNPHLYKSFPILEHFEERSISTNGFSIFSKQLNAPSSADLSIGVSTDQGDLAVRSIANFKDPNRCYEQLFIFKGQLTNTPMNVFETEKVFEFEVDADEINESFKKFRAAIKKIFLRGDSSNDLLIEGSHKDVSAKVLLPITVIDHTGDEVLGTTKLNSNDIKGFFSGYEGNIQVSILQFYVDGRDFYKLECSNDGIKSYAVIIKEPNFENIQKNLDKILEFQKKLPYI